MERFNYGISCPEEILNHVNSSDFYFDYCYLHDEIDNQIGFVFTSFVDAEEDEQVSFVCDENIADKVEAFIKENF